MPGLKTDLLQSNTSHFFATVFLQSLFLQVAALPCNCMYNQNIIGDECN